MHPRQNRSKSTGHDRRGFTITEVLVIIAVISILAAILLPLISHSRKKANRNRDLNNLKQLVNTFTMFGNDHNGRFPWVLSKNDANAAVQVFSPGGGGAWRYQWDSCMDIRRLWQMQSILDSLPSCRMLLSPCDPQAKYDNKLEASPERNFWGWEGPMDKKTKEGKANWGFKFKELNERAQSYSVCFGAYFEKGDKGILLLTRNHGGAWGSGYEYKYPSDTLIHGGRTVRRGSMVDLGKCQRWLDHKKDRTDQNNRDFISRLDTNEGQMAFCDGSAFAADDKALKEAIQDHAEPRAGGLKIENFNTARPRHRPLN